MVQSQSTSASTVHVFLLRGADVLLLRRLNTGCEDSKHSVVAGYLEGGEQVRAAASRERCEEAGAGVAPDELDGVGVMHRLSNDERIGHSLVADRWAGELTNCEPQRCDHLAWLGVDQLPALSNYRERRSFDRYGLGADEP